MRSQRRNALKRLASGVVGLIAGTVIGFVDVGATEVQGSLLLLMVAAFGLALGAVAVLLGVVAIAASSIPARRASGVSPVEALRGGG